jgi:dTDP-4-amino-4,6-dideoxygalactose transaminase
MTDIVVPFNDFKVQISELREEIETAIASVLDRAWFIMGPENEAFQQEFATYLGVEHVVGVANGTEAIQLALLALGIGNGDEVICPALTAAPTALAILATGAQPVFADIHPQTYTLDPSCLEACFSPKTKAILPVHLYGHPANMRDILSFAKARDLPVVEDVAQAHGAKVEGNMTGTLGIIGCFSFYPTKNLGAYGDGGALVTGDPELAHRLSQLRDLGQKGRFQHVLPGMNSRLDEIQAAILRVKLKYLDAQNAKRRERASWYCKLLRDTESVQLPIEQADYSHVYHLFVIQTEQRDRLRSHMREHGIGSDVHYPQPLHRQPAFAECRISPEGLRVSESVVERIISLPMYPLLSRQQVEAVVGSISSFID